MVFHMFLNIGNGCLCDYYQWIVKNIPLICTNNYLKRQLYQVQTITCQNTFLNNSKNEGEKSHFDSYMLFSVP